MNNSRVNPYKELMEDECVQQIFKNSLIGQVVKKEDLLEPYRTDYQQLIADSCDEIKNLLLTKNREYGNAAFEPKRIFSKASAIEQIKVRIDDKLSRLMTDGEKTIKEDTVMDLIGYLILLRAAGKLQKNK